MKRFEAGIFVKASPEAVYALVADVTRMGEHSPECRACEWLDGAQGPAAGARFLGHNHVGPAKWDRAARITAAEPGREFTFLTESRFMGRTRWSYKFVPDAGGTLVTEACEIVWMSTWFQWLSTVLRMHNRLPGNLEHTLRRIKIEAEGE